MNPKGLCALTRGHWESDLSQLWASSPSPRLITWLGPAKVFVPLSCPGVLGLYQVQRGGSGRVSSPFHIIRVEFSLGGEQEKEKLRSEAFGSSSPVLESSSIEHVPMPQKCSLFFKTLFK